MAIIAIIIFVKLFDWLDERTFNNYMPPQGMDIDYNAASLDQIRNHLSNQQLKYNIVHGKYNVPKDQILNRRKY